MGWTDSHLHQFLAGHIYYGKPEPEYGADHEDDRRTRLSRVLYRPKDAMVYEYDFSDGWEHILVLERIVEPVTGAQCPPRMLAASVDTTSSCRQWPTRVILNIAR